jgi:hypothetical protein
MKRVSWGPGGFHKLANKKANIWLTTAAVLAIVVVFIFTAVAPLLGSPLLRSNAANGLLGANFVERGNKLTVADLLSPNSPPLVSPPVSSTSPEVIPPAPITPVNVPPATQPVATTAATPVLPPDNGIIVTAPKAGDIWYLSGDYDIKWTTTDGKPINAAYVVLQKVGEPEVRGLVIAGGNWWDSYDWIPAWMGWMQTGHDYYVRIIADDGKGGHLVGRSGIIHVAMHPNVGIKFTAPSSAESHKAGDSMHLSWCATDSSLENKTGETVVFLVDGGGQQQGIIYRRVNSGLPSCSSGKAEGFDWAVPKFLPPAEGRPVFSGNYQFVVMYREPLAPNVVPTLSIDDQSLYGFDAGDAKIFIDTKP